MRQRIWALLSAGAARASTPLQGPTPAYRVHLPSALRSDPVKHRQGDWIVTGQEAVKSRRILLDGICRSQRREPHAAPCSPHPRRHPEWAMMVTARFGSGCTGTGANGPPRLVARPSDGATEAELLAACPRLEAADVRAALAYAADSVAQEIILSQTA